MTATLIDGKDYAQKITQSVKDEVALLTAQTGIQPGLAVILVGTDPASEIYVKNKIHQTTHSGMRSFAYRLPNSITEQELTALINRFNEDENIHGILVQLPLPQHINSAKIIETIDPLKDVDGFTSINAGYLVNRQTCHIPCTPKGCLMLIKSVISELQGKAVTIVGCSSIVGKPLIQLMLAENCTVSVVHKYTNDKASLVKLADIVIVAAGVPNLIPGDWLKEGVVVIDVGINRIDVNGTKKIVGDVNFDEASKIASAITPVPGGVGPMTIACLLDNTLIAYKQQTSLFNHQTMISKSRSANHV